MQKKNILFMLQFFYIFNIKSVHFYIESMGCTTGNNRTNRLTGKVSDYYSNKTYLRHGQRQISNRRCLPETFEEHASLLIQEGNETHEQNLILSFRNRCLEVICVCV